MLVDEYDSGTAVAEKVRKVAVVMQSSHIRLGLAVRGTTGVDLDIEPKGSLSDRHMCLTCWSHQAVG